MQSRRSLRLAGYDYSSERLYLVTVCTLDRRFLLGHIADESVCLSRYGEIVRAQIAGLPERTGVVVGVYVVMPNHVHVLLDLGAGTRARQASPLRLGTVVGGFKAGSSRDARRSLWQRGYHDHIVRDERDLERVREYIAANPITWALDPENPARRLARPSIRHRAAS
ncbi:MAG: transposase [Gaiellaceae bacterium]